MFDVKKFWSEARAAAAAIEEEFPFVTSVEDTVSGAKGGVLCQVSREDAGVLLAKKTHRLSTAEEIAGYRANEEELRAEYRRQEQDRRLLAVLQPPATPAPPTTKGKGDK